MVCPPPRSLVRKDGYHLMVCRPPRSLAIKDGHHLMGSLHPLSLARKDGHHPMESPLLPSQARKAQGTLDGPHLAVTDGPRVGRQTHRVKVNGVADKIHHGSIRGLSVA